MNALEIIEAVARAMHGNRYEWPRPEFAERRDEYREWAKTAILAMLDAIREPTQAQLDAVCSDDAHAEPFTDKIIRSVYQDMIDVLKCEVAG